MTSPLHLDATRRRLLGATGAHPALLGLGLGVVFLGIVALELIADRPGTAAATTVATAGSLVLAVCVVVHRQMPITALLVGCVALVAQSAADATLLISPYATLLCAYAAGRYSTRDRALWGPVILAAAIAGFFVGTPPTTAFDVAYVAVVWLATWVVGYNTARRHEDEERARRAVREKLVAQERTRIAREMHDIVGHALNLLVVQAGAARVSLDQDPGTSRDLLLSMERTGRDALMQLDDVLGLLRESSPGEVLDAGPEAVGVMSLPELVDRLDDSGLRIVLGIDETLTTGQRLPHDVDLAAYRIVQESLTNALKHAAPCTARIEVRVVGNDLLVDVADDGPGCAPARRPGRGLAGIAERATRCGGTVQHGPDEHGGFRVRATLPLERPIP